MLIEDNMEIYTTYTDSVEDEGVTRTHWDCPHCNNRTTLIVDPGDNIRVNGVWLARIVSGIEITSDGHSQRDVVTCPYCGKTTDIPENNDNTEETDDEPVVRP